MKVASPYRCDYCGAPRGEANHWWLRITVMTSFVLEAWSDALAADDGVEHICSEACVTKALSKWMREQRRVPVLFLKTQYKASEDEKNPSCAALE